MAVHLRENKHFNTLGSRHFSSAQAGKVISVLGIFQGLRSSKRPSNVLSSQRPDGVQLRRLEIILHAGEDIFMSHTVYEPDMNHRITE